MICNPVISGGSNSPEMITGTVLGSTFYWVDENYQQHKSTGGTITLPKGTLIATALPNTMSFVSSWEGITKMDEDSFSAFGQATSNGFVFEISM